MRKASGPPLTEHHDRQADQASCVNLAKRGDCCLGTARPELRWPGARAAWWSYQAAITPFSVVPGIGVT